MLPPKLFVRPLSQGVGYLGPHSSRAPHIPLLLSRMAQGRMLYHLFVQAMQIVASIVGVPLTLLENAPGPGRQIKAKALTRTTRTKARGRLFRSSKGGSISPLLQNSRKKHQ